MDRDERRVVALARALKSYVEASRRVAQVPAEHDRAAAVLDAQRLRGTAWVLLEHGETELDRK